MRLRSLKLTVGALVCALVLSVALNLSGFVFWWHYAQLPGENDIVPKATVNVLVDAMVIKGGIRSDTIEKVRYFLDHPDAGILRSPLKPLSLVAIDSGGGNGLVAAEMVGLFNERHMKLEIDPGSDCLSACVYVFAYSRDHDADPDAWLGFHQGWVDMPGFHSTLSLVFRGKPDQQPVYMDHWAKEISPRLLAFFQTCRNNPLRDIDGMVLRWSEIKQIADGIAAFDCDGLTDRTFPAHRRWRIEQELQRHEH